MKRAVLHEFDQLGDTLSNCCSMFAYKLMNLCVKAEEVSLLPVEVLIAGEFKKLEECTTISKKDDYNFMVFPTYDEDLKAVGQAFLQVHPEFKQTIESMTIECVDENGNPKDVETRYILLTMPEVDDDRYDLLKEGVKLCYDDCKAKLEAANAQADAKIAPLTVDESEEDIKKLKNAREKLNEQWNGQRDKVYNAKLEEIEDAHNKWLAEKSEKDQKRQEDEAAHSSAAATSMRMDQDDLLN